MQVCAAVAVVAVVGACQSSVELDADPARVLQADVLALTTAVAAGRWDTVEAELREAREHLDAALESGEVSVARYRQIDDALDTVAAEVEDERDRLAAAAAAAEAAAEHEAAEQEAAEQEAAEEAAAEEAAGSSDDPAPTEPRAPKKDDEPKGKDDPGPPKDKGKGRK
jgi:chromosome segregation ATPase